MTQRWRAVLLLVALVTSCIGAATPAQAIIPIQPGGRTSLVDLAGQRQAIGFCSLGYVFDGQDDLEGKVFIATAAHCATDVGDDVMLLETSEVFGEFAVIGNRKGAAGDWALIEVFPAFHDRVSPAFEGYPDFPTGYTVPGKTKADDAIRNTDWPDAGTIPRESVLVEDAGQSYVIDGPVIPFDSGGPLAHIPSGAALGIVSQGHNCAFGPFSCETYSGPTVQGILGHATGAGFPVTLRTV